MSRYLGKLVTPAKVKPHRWSLDPARVDPDWRWVWEQVWFAVPLWEDTFVPGLEALDVPIFEYISHEKLFLDGTAWNWVRTEHGLAISFTTTDRLRLSLGKEIREPRTQSTVLLIRRNHDTTARESSSFGTGSSGGGDPGHRIQAHLPFSDGIVYWDFGGSSGANRLTVAHTKTTNIEYWAFTAGSQGSAIYLNGNELASQSTAITRTASTDNWGIHSGATFAGDNEDIYLLMFLNTQWSAAQVAEWYQDPYGMIREEPRPQARPEVAATTTTTEFLPEFPDQILDKPTAIPYGETPVNTA